MRYVVDELVVAGALGSAWADWDDGTAAYAAGDYRTAYRKWFPLADRGDAKAQYNLGVIHANGKGVPRNYEAAAKWYRKAAELGHAGAQFGLGSCYFLGRGVPENHVRACLWLILAKSGGHKKALANIEIVEKRMTPAQIDKAQELAAEWREKLKN